MKLTVIAVIAFFCSNVEQTHVTGIKMDHLPAAFERNDSVMSQTNGRLIPLRTTISKRVLDSSRGEEENSIEMASEEEEGSSAEEGSGEESSADDASGTLNSAEEASGEEGSREESSADYASGTLNSAEEASGEEGSREESSADEGTGEWDSADEANLKDESCVGYGWGDPHVITFDGLEYDVHVKGELIFVKSLNSEFEIQGRTESVKNLPEFPSVTTGIVINEIGDNPRIQVSLARDASSGTYTEMFRATECSENSCECPVQLFVDGVERSVSSGSGTSKASVTVIEVGKEKGKIVIIEYPETKVEILMEVHSWEETCHFSVAYTLADCRPNENIVGLLGSPNGEWRDDWMQRDGIPLRVPGNVHRESGFEATYNYTRDNWCIYKESDSYFVYEANTDFAYFDECDNPYDPSLEEAVANANPDIVKACDGDISCVVEGVALGTDAAVAYLKNPALNHTVKESEAIEITDEPTNSPESQQEIDVTDLPDINQGPSDSGSLGDPHFKSWKNEHFEFHGQCDLVLTSDPNFAHGLGMDVHIRTKLVRFWSYIKNAAIRIGDDILEVQGSTDADDQTEAIYWYNLEYQGKMSHVGGFPITVDISNAKSHKRTFEIDLSSKYPGEKIVISTFYEFVRVDFVNASAKAFGKTIGMLGDYNTGKTLARDGETIMDDFYELGNEWQVLPAEYMLFHSVSDPQFPKRCILPEDPRGNRHRRLGEESISSEEAKAACAKRLNDPLDVKDCVYDILATQNLDMVGAF